MGTEFIEIPLQSRSCECCGSDDLESMWSSDSFVVKSSASYLFKVFVVICRKCGFCFSSPCYNNEYLNQYYSDGLSGCKDMMLPYSVERRVSFLKKYAVPKGIFAEIGGDQPEEFHRSLSRFFKRIVNVELTAHSGAEYNNIKDMPSGIVDVVAHYDVLEHVPQITDFLMACKRILKENGLMVCEVPDIRLYPRNILLTEYEHVNHFSATSLSSIAAKCGFELIELEHICSRPFGFLSVFRKTNISSAQDDCNLPFEYLDALSCIKGAIHQIERVYRNIESIRENIAELTNKKKKATIWCVTDLLHRLINNFELPNNVVVVDTDPRRQAHLKSYGIEVFQPMRCIDHIKSCDLLVICAPRYKAEIIEWIYKHTGKRFKNFELEVMGVGPSGESLI